MKPTETIKRIMALQKVKPIDLCKKLNIKSNVLFGRINQENISIFKLHEILDAMDYKIITMPKETDTPDDGIEIEYE